jgi:prepilin peptidase CpaA
MTDYVSDLAAMFMQHWPVWCVTITLIVAAVIDGYELKVPNWITFPMIACGWVYSAALSGMPWYEGLAWSLFGTGVGLALLMPAYSIGGMGAGDVKLLAGVGAWVHGEHTFYAFCVSAIIGAVLAVLMVLAQKAWAKHYNQFFSIAKEIATVKSPEKLSVIAAERKPRMMLLPYGIPIAIGTICYFAYQGMLV